MKSIKLSLVIILIGIIIFSLFKIINKEVGYSTAKKGYENIRNDVKNNLKGNMKNNIDSSNIEDFTSKLTKINNDYKLWIKVEGTNIDYPVVQGKDNEFYLNHDFFREESFSGCLFIDYRNSLNNDNNIIIYGHNMKNKTMFNNLDNFKNADFFEENNKINITINNKIENYEVIGIVVDSESETYLSGDFSLDNKLKEYINSKALYKRSQENTQNDKYLTLYTCSFEYNKARTIIYAKRVNE